MSRLLVLLLLLVVHHQIQCIKTSFSVGVGPAWNQVIAVEHFTLNAQNNVPAKAVVSGFDDPCVAAVGSLLCKFRDKYYGQVTVFDVAGNRGAVFLRQSVQESPFTVFANLDGKVSLHFFGIGLGAGVLWPLTEKFSFTLGGGYLCSIAQRITNFERNPLSIRTRNISQAAVIKCGPIIKLNDYTKVAAFYVLSIGNVHSHVRTFNPSDVTRVTFPLVMGNLVAIDALFKVTKKVRMSLAAFWYTTQNSKAGSVRPSPENALLVSNRRATYFRSQFHAVIASLHYEF